MKIISRDCINSNQTLFRRSGRRWLLPKVLTSEAGFTMVELLVVAAILGIIISLAIPGFNTLLDRLKITRAISEIRSIEKSVLAHIADNADYPNSLNEVNMGSWTDPWGNSYQYLNIANGGAPRQSQFLNDLNQHFDIYSLGPDGVTTQVVSDAEGLDDVIRATDGGWVGVGGDF